MVPFQGVRSGAQVQLVLTAALTWALAFVLALRLTGARPWLVWLATVAVAFSATGFIYSSEVYPEMPAGLVLVGALLLSTGGEQPGVGRVLLRVVLLSTLPWLGAKYAPLAALVALYTCSGGPTGKAGRHWSSEGSHRRSPTARSTSRPTGR